MDIDPIEVYEEFKAAVLHKQAEPVKTARIDPVTVARYGIGGALAGGSLALVGDPCRRMVVEGDAFYGQLKQLPLPTIIRLFFLIHLDFLGPRSWRHPAAAFPLYGQAKRRMVEVDLVPAIEPEPQQPPDLPHQQLPLVLVQGALNLHGDAG